MKPSTSKRVSSIFGHLTARPSRDLVEAANIEITREWWDARRSYFQLYASQAVVKETSQGDAEIAAQRLEIICNLELLELNQSVLDLAEQFLARSSLPAKVDVDAVHIAAATVHGMDYLLTFKENWQKSVSIWDTSSWSLIMYQDSIVEEIHRIREEYSRSFDRDLKAIFADLQKQQAESGRKVVNLSRKTRLTTRWSGQTRDIGEDAKNISRRST